MEYRLRKQTGDTVAVPAVIFTNLSRADENCVRVALYLLSSGSTEPRDIAHTLGLKSVQAAEKALQWWAGAGLLEADGAPAPVVTEPLRQEEINFASLRDPMIATLVEEAQAHLGRTLGHADLSRLVGLYLNEDFAPEVLLLCLARLAQSEGPKTLGALDRQLHSWRQAGVETGEDAERYLILLDRRAEREERATQLLSLSSKDLTLADRRSIRRWYEEFGFDDSMVEEAVLQAGEKKSVRYVNGILKAWHGRGLTTVQQVRGGGALTGESAGIRIDKKVYTDTEQTQAATSLVRRPLRLKRED